MSHSFHGLPMFGFACLGFLMIGVILAVAVWLAFRSGQNGTTKLGGFAGCFVALALVFVAGLGAFGCIAVGVLNAPNEFLRHGPIRRIEAHFPERSPDRHARSGDPKDAPPATSPSPAPDSTGLHIRVEMTGGDEAQISRWFREHTDGDVTFTVEPIDGPDGRRTRIDVRIPITDDEMREMRSHLERDLPNLNLPSDIRVELKGDDD